MNKDKNSLINNENSQGISSKLLLCLTITFLLINGLTLYKGIDGQKTNSSILPANNTITIKNTDIPIKKSNQSNVGSIF